MAECLLAKGGGGSSFDNIGSATRPVYINADGDAVQCNDKLANSISGTADYVASSQSNGTQFYVGGMTGANAAMRYNTNVYINSSNVLRGAAWNDYAEYRLCAAQPGSCVIEQGDGSLICSRKRLQKGAALVSDTYGFIIGPEGSEYKAIAVAGRVLAYIDGDHKLKAGDPVCSGKNGTVSKMSWLETFLFPDRILGYVSEVPNYKEWNSVSVDNRVWIKVN